MAKIKYALNWGEEIVFKTSCVRHGFWGAYTNSMTITNQSVILEKYGVMNNFKGIERFNYSDIKQAILGEASNGQKQLELYIGSKVEDFALQSGDKDELKILVMSINDQMRSNPENHDFNYYQSILSDAKDTSRISELKSKIRTADVVPNVGRMGIGENESDEFGFIGSVAKEFIKSGNYSTKGITKAVKKTMKKNVWNGIKNEFMDEIGLGEIQDEFIEIENGFREGLGLKTKMTRAEMQELKDLEAKKMAQEATKRQSTQGTFKHNYTQEVEYSQSNVETKMSVKEQMELLKQLKELFDNGILNEEEFEQKKQEILKG